MRRRSKDWTSPTIGIGRCATPCSASASAAGTFKSPYPCTGISWRSWTRLNVGRGWFPSTRRAPIGSHIFWKSFICGPGTLSWCWWTNTTGRFSTHFLQSASVLRSQQSEGHHSGPRLFRHLWIYGRGLGRCVRPGTPRGSTGTRSAVDTTVTTGRGAEKVNNSLDILLLFANREFHSY